MCSGRSAVRVTRFGSTSPDAPGPPLAATRAMPQIVHLAAAESDLIHGCMGHW